MAGYKPGSSQFGSIGAVYGEKTHTQTSAELATHSHGISDPGHSHTQRKSYNGQLTYDTGSTHPAGMRWETQTIIDSGDVGASFTGVSAQNAGSGAAFNVIQPTRAALMCIKI